jgi:NADH-quinone oxidoreductase subunit I
MWLVKGLFVTLKKLLMPKITQRYPEVYPDLPEATRGAFKFNTETCTACNLCAIACPNKVIHVTACKGLDGKRQVDQYKMSLGYCLYCGLCVEACPTEAIQMQPQFNGGYYKKANSLSTWTYEGPKSC